MTDLSPSSVIQAIISPGLKSHPIEFELSCPPQIVDQLFIGRYVLLSVASVAFLAALFMLLPYHLLEPVYAKPLRTR